MADERARCSHCYQPQAGSQCMRLDCLLQRHKDWPVESSSLEEDWGEAMPSLLARTPLSRVPFPVAAGLRQLAAVEKAALAWGNRAAVYLSDPPEGAGASETEQPRGNLGPELRVLRGGGGE